MQVVLDVRTKEEWDAGHKPDAIHFDVALLTKGQLPDIPRESEVHVYCRSGARAALAREILLSNGFTTVYNDGGYAER